MEFIGILIKQERLKRNMKQITLCKGICTPSYLSKIENNKITPGEDIITLLLRRLEIETKLRSNQSFDSIQEIQILYKEAITNRDKDAIKKVTNWNLESAINFNESDFITLKLIHFRLFIKLEDTKMIDILLKLLNNLKNKFTKYQEFLFNLNCGLTYYSKGDFSASLPFLENNLDIINKFSLEPWELADFYYLISVSYLMNNRSYNSLTYSQKALKIFWDNHFFDRAIDSHIVLALSQKRNHQYIQAEETFKLARKLALQFNLDNSVGRINQNLGALFSIQGNSKKAIQYYILSMENDRGLDSYLISLHSIIQEYSKLNLSEKVIEWSQKGLTKIERLSSPENQTYSYHFNIYLNLHLKSNTFIKVVKNSIKFFEEKKDFRHIHKYSLLLASYLLEVNRFKEAGVYFKKSNEAIFHQKSIKHWEDL